jgi:hypothetical protein
MPFSGMLRCVALVRTKVSEELFLTIATRSNIPEKKNPHSHRREKLKSYIVLTGCALLWRGNVSPVKYELGFYISEEDLHIHRRENLKSYRKYHGQFFLDRWMNRAI